MALSDKNIVITPNKGQSSDPKIVFSGADASTGPQNITLQVYPTNSGTLSFEGSAGQLLTIKNNFSGSIFSVNDVSGVPSIEVLDSGLVKLAQYGGNVLIGTGTDSGARLQVNGKIRNGSIWINNGDDVNGYNENIRLFNASNGVSVIAFSASGTSGIPTTSILGFSDRFETRFNDVWQNRIYNGYSEASGSYRAPIFYDSNDTTYYVDPSSTGTALNTVGSANFGNAGADTGVAIFHGGGSGDYGRIRFYQAGSNNQTIHAFPTTWQGGTLSSSSAGAINISGANGVTLGSWNVINSTGHWFDNSGNGQSSVSFRSPIFYDSNDTGYYVDAAGTSNFNNVYIQGGVAGVSNSAAYHEAAIEVRERNFGGAQDDTWATAPRIGFHWGGRVASQIAISSAGRIVILNNPGNAYEDFQANIFYGAIYYDSGNTGFYTDPANSGTAGNFNGTVNAVIFNTTSDLRLKENLEPITSALEKIKAITGFTYNFKDDEKKTRHAGVVAQEVEKVLPEAVSGSEINTYKVSYSDLVALLVEAVKEQQILIEKLMKRT